MSFSQLPEELLYVITDNIYDLVDLVNLSVCSKRLKSICNSTNCKNINVYGGTKLILS